MKIKLETSRLTLRRMEREDARELYEYAKNPNVGPHGGWKPHESVEESLEIIEKLFIPSDTFAIIHKASQKLIGAVSLEKDKRRPEMKSREVGYSLAEEFWGQGYMTEAVKEVLRYVFEEKGLDIVAITANPANTRSLRVIEKCGFVYEGLERFSNYSYDGSPRDSKCFSLKKEEWDKLK